MYAYWKVLLEKEECADRELFIVVSFFLLQIQQVLYIILYNLQPSGARTL